MHSFIQYILYKTHNYKTKIQHDILSLCIKNIDKKKNEIKVPDQHYDNIYKFVYRVINKLEYDYFILNLFKYIKTNNSFKYKRIFKNMIKSLKIHCSFFGIINNPCHG